MQWCHWRSGSRRQRPQWHCPGQIQPLRFKGPALRARDRHPYRLIQPARHFFYLHAHHLYHCLHYQPLVVHIKQTGALAYVFQTFKAQFLPLTPTSMQLRLEISVGSIKAKNIQDELSLCHINRH